MVLYRLRGYLDSQTMYFVVQSSLQMDAATKTRNTAVDAGLADSLRSVDSHKDEEETSCGRK